MTRGKIVLVTNNRVFETTEFNGDMGPDMVIGILTTQLIDKINSRQDLENAAAEINKYYGYSEKLVYIKNKEHIKSFSKRTYFKRWFSDYLYVINRRDTALDIKDYNGRMVQLQPNEYGIFRFGTLISKHKSKKKRLVYIAHPFTSNGNIDENKKKVLKYVKLVLENGDIPICTITMFGDLYGHIDEETAMKSCLSLIESADKVMFAGDWKNSKGCLKEFEYAKKIGKEIVYA